MKRMGRHAWSVGALLVLALLATWSARAVAQVPPEHSVARIWNERLLDAIRTDIPKPPVHARNLYHLSVAMYDAWAHYDPIAQGYLYTEKAATLAPLPPVDGSHSIGVSSDPPGTSHFAARPPWKSDVTGWGSDEGTDDEVGDDEDGDEDEDEEPEPDVLKIYDPAIEAARAEAISFAAYRVLQYRFPTATTCHPGAAAAQAAFSAQMDALGYDKTFTSTVGDSPAAVGNRIAQIVIAYGQADGANEGPTLCYPDNTAYAATNPNLIFTLPGNPSMIHPNRWQWDPLESTCRHASLSIL